MDGSQSNKSVNAQNYKSTGAGNNEAKREKHTGADVSAEDTSFIQHQEMDSR